MSATDQAELDAILAAARDEPDEDVHRLAAADWWDDHGDGDRAEFVRVQLSLARLDAELMATERCGDASCPGCRERAALEARQRNLLQWPQFWDWFGPALPLSAWPGSPAVSISPDLTSRRGVTSPGQRAWLDALRRVPGVQVCEWRDGVTPWEEVEGVLR